MRWYWEQGEEWRAISALEFRTADFGWLKAMLGRVLKDKAWGVRDTHKSSDLIFKDHLLQAWVAHANQQAGSDPSPLLSPSKVTYGDLVWSCVSWSHRHTREGPKKGGKDDERTEVAHIWGKTEGAEPIQPGEEKAQEAFLSMCINISREVAKTEPGSFQLCLVTVPEAVGTNWNRGCSVRNIRKQFYCEGDWSLT